MQPTHAIAVTAEGKRYYLQYISAVDATFTLRPEKKVEPEDTHIFKVMRYKHLFKLLRDLTKAKPIAMHAGLRQEIRKLVGINVYVTLSIEDEAGVELGSMAFVPNPIVPTK